jgi:ribosomal protein S12 methylthiotransferase
MSKKIKFITLGCSKNLVDTEHLMAQLKESNLDYTFDGKDADFDSVVINTCGFIHDAKEESIEIILQHIDAKSQGLIDNVFVMGCLSERYMENLKEEIPEVDRYFGVKDIPGIVEALGIDYRKELVGERVLTTPRHYAYLKIAEGCDRTCAFCAIPLIRGKHISTPVEKLKMEAQQLVNQGVKELILISQELSYYGIDIYGKRELPRLIRELSSIQGLHWIRLHYLYPVQIEDELLDEIRTNDKVCNYIDIPIQHISDPILKNMRRSHNKEHTLRILERIRKKLPQASIRTTLISGFPGETEQDHNELLSLISNFRFDRLGVFTYSHEEDTKAFEYEDNVPQEVKQRRMEEIMELQQDISWEINQAKTGKTFQVIIDRKDADYYYGRTESDSPDVDNEVLVSSDFDLTIGNFYSIKITKADYFDLYGEPE